MVDRFSLSFQMRRRRLQRLGNLPVRSQTEPSTPTSQQEKSLDESGGSLSLSPSPVKPVSIKISSIHYVMTSSDGICYTFTYN